MKRPILPISYIQTQNPMMKKQVINKYTAEGRALIHKKLGRNNRSGTEMVKRKSSYK